MGKVSAKAGTETYGKCSKTSGRARKAVLEAAAVVFRHTAVSRRAGWGFADQALSSLTNFGLGIFVAATVSAEQFGTFALIYGA
jgi:hypothetical protein